MKPKRRGGSKRKRPIVVIHHHHHQHITYTGCKIGYGVWGAGSTQNNGGDPSSAFNTADVAPKKTGVGSGGGFIGGQDHCNIGHGMWGPQSSQTNNGAAAVHVGAVATPAAVWMGAWPGSGATAYQAVPEMPGDVTLDGLEPIGLIGCNDRMKYVYNVRLTNNGAHRIGWAIKATNMKCLAVDPPAGCVDSKEGQMIGITCEPFDFGSEDSNNGRIFIEWTNAPEGAKQFHREWFEGNDYFRRKILPIENTL